MTKDPLRDLLIIRLTALRNAGAIVWGQFQPINLSGEAGKLALFRELDLSKKALDKVSHALHPDSTDENPAVTVARINLSHKPCRE